MLGRVYFFQHGDIFTEICMLNAIPTELDEKGG